MVPLRSSLSLSLFLYVQFVPLSVPPICAGWFKWPPIWGSHNLQIYENMKIRLAVFRNVCLCVCSALVNHSTRNWWQWIPYWLLGSTISLHIACAKFTTIAINCCEGLKPKQTVRNFGIWQFNETACGTVSAKSIPSCAR